MSAAVKRSLVLFIITSLLVAAILFLLPINLFDGEVVWSVGDQEVVKQQPLSLSYFIGMGYDEADMVDVVDFYLKPTGWITAIIIILGIPGLFAYRMYLKATTPKDTE